MLKNQEIALNKKEDDDYPVCCNCGARATRAKCYVSGIEYCYLDEDGYYDEVYDSETTDTNDSEYYCDDCI